MGDDDVAAVVAGQVARGFAEQMPDDAAGHVLDVHHPLAQVRIVNFDQGAAVALRDLVKDGLDVLVILLQAAQNFIDQGAVLDHQQVGVENTGILGADGVGNTLLDLEQFRAGGDEGGLKSGDLLGEFLSRDGALGDFLVIHPVDDDLGLGDAGGNSYTLEPFLLFGFGLGFTAAHQSRRTSKSRGRQKPILPRSGSGPGFQSRPRPCRHQRPPR